MSLSFPDGRKSDGMLIERAWEQKGSVGGLIQLNAPAADACLMKLAGNPANKATRRPRVSGSQEI
jgi:hypothetical protein